MVYLAMTLLAAFTISLVSLVRNGGDPDGNGSFISELL